MMRRKMATNKTYLPPKDSERGKQICDLYPTASKEQLQSWREEYGYKSVKTFKVAVRERYEINREPNSGWEPTEINIPLEIKTGKEPKTAAILNDLQMPYHDAEVLALVENFLIEIQPDYEIFNGDIFDFYALSDFDKNPNRINRMQDELDLTKAMLRRHHAILPKAIKKLIIGNHEDRLRRFLWTRAKELATLRCLTVEELLGLKDYNIELIAYEQGLMVNDVFLIIHGDIASIHSGYTAKRMFEKHGGCGICGHCHRGGSFYKRDRFGIWGWWENFCLCHLNPDWIKNPNWVQGFSLVHFQGDRFWVEQIPIVNKKFMYGGKVYG
jgi:hypothetical protein